PASTSKNWRTAWRYARRKTRGEPSQWGAAPAPQVRRRTRGEPSRWGAAPAPQVRRRMRGEDRDGQYRFPGRTRGEPRDFRPMIRLRGVTRCFQLGEQRVMGLDAVDLDVAAGEYLAVSGASGSGKSTLLNILGLLDAPDSGEY